MLIEGNKRGIIKNKIFGFIRKKHSLFLGCIRCFALYDQQASLNPLRRFTLNKKDKQ